MPGMQWAEAIMTPGTQTVLLLLMGPVFAACIALALASKMIAATGLSRIRLSRQLSSSLVVFGKDWTRQARSWLTE